MPRNRTSPPPLLVAEDAHSHVGCYETDFPSPARGKQPVVQQPALHLHTAKQRQELGLRNGWHRRDRYQAWRAEGALPVNGMLSLCSPTWDEGGTPMIAASCKGASKRTAGRPGSTVHQRRRPFPRRPLLPLDLLPDKTAGGPKRIRRETEISSSWRQTRAVGHLLPVGLAPLEILGLQQPTPFFMCHPFCPLDCAYRLGALELV